MRRQGRIDDEVFANISIKLKNQSEEAAKGLPISKENYLTKEELGQVLQPIKPVYTGQILDVGQDVARTVYVKSSSATKKYSKALNASARKGSPVQLAILVSISVVVNVIS